MPAPTSAPGVCAAGGAGSPDPGHLQQWGASSTGTREEQEEGSAHLLLTSAGRGLRLEEASSLFKVTARWGRGLGSGASPPLSSL